MTRGMRTVSVSIWLLLLTAVAALVLACGMSPATAFADQDDADLVPAAGMTAQAASGTWGTCPWTIDGEGTLTVNPGTGASQDGEYHSPWGSYSASIKKVVFATGADGSKIVAPNNISSLFYMMGNITSVDLRGLDTSSTQDLQNMFYGCSALQSVNVTGLDTSNVTGISGLFGGCSSLREVAGFEGLNLSKADSLAYTFYNCSALTVIDLSCLAGASITSGRSAFEGCTSLLAIDLSGISTSQMYDATKMFYNCSALKTVYVDDGWTVAGITNDNYGYMFVGCTNIVGGQGTTYDQSHAAAQWARIDGGPTSDTPGYLTRSQAATGMWGDCAWTLSNVGVLVVGPGTGTAPTYYKSPWDDYKDRIVRVAFKANGDSKVKAPANCAYLLCGLQNMQSVDFSGMDASVVTSMKHMFTGCTALATVDLSAFGNAPLSENGLAGLFGADSFTELSGCRSLASVDLRPLNTSNVTQLTSLFEGCVSLESVNMTGLDTAKVSNIISMFNGCAALTTITGFGGLNLSGVTSIDAVFKGCASLASIDFSGLNGAEMGPAAFNYTFSGCSNLETVDFSGLVRTEDAGADGTFENCSKLTTIYVGDGWGDYVLDDDLDPMFAGCTSLVGGAGTTYDAKYENHLYARVDGGPTSKSPGYFTYKKASEKVSLSNATVTLSATNFTYNGSVQKPTVKSVVVDGNTLTATTDYTVSYSNNNPTNVGAYTVTVTGAGNYKDSKSAQFSIAAKSLSNAKVTLSPTSYTYDGTEKKPTVTVALDGKTLSATTDYMVSYSNNKAVGTATATVTGKNNYKDTAKGTYAIVAESESGVKMHRLYNPNSGEHFYTGSEKEYKEVKAAGWNDEGIGWTAPEKSATPVYRLYNANGGEHHYTMSAGERDGLVKAGWKYEGIGWYSDDAKTVPLYREYNPNEFANNHNYTTNKKEHDWLMSLGWKNEGYAWYGV